MKPPVEMFTRKVLVTALLVNVVNVVALGLCAATHPHTRTCESESRTFTTFTTFTRNESQARQYPAASDTQGHS